MHDGIDNAQSSRFSHVLVKFCVARVMDHGDTKEKNQTIPKTRRIAAPVMIESGPYITSILYARDESIKLLQ